MIPSVLWYLMVGWHHQHNGHEFEQALGVGDGQGGLKCCGPWGGKEWDMTWVTELNWNIAYFKNPRIVPSTLAWKIPWMEEPGRLQSMGSQRVGHNWVTSLSLFTLMHWRRTWQPTPVFLPGESQGRRSLVGCHLWGRTESDTTDVT